LDVVNGDLTLGQDATVKGTENPQAIKVNGTIYCEGLDTFECNVTAEGFEAEEKVTIHGNLTTVAAQHVVCEDVGKHGKWTRACRSGNFP